MAMVIEVGDQPSNGASELAREYLEFRTDLARPAGESARFFADDFVSEDKRTLIGLPDLDKVSYLDEISRNVSEFGRVLNELEVLSIRGDQLALARYASHHPDGSAREYLAIAQTDETGSRFQRFVRFDVADLDAALAELNRLNAEIGD